MASVSSQTDPVEKCQCLESFAKHDTKSRLQYDIIVENLIRNDHCHSALIRKELSSDSTPVTTFSSASTSKLDSSEEDLLSEGPEDLSEGPEVTSDSDFLPSDEEQHNTTPEENEVVITAD